MPLNEKPLPLFVQRKVAKGKTYYYFRWRDFYSRLPDNPNSEAFRQEYARKLSSVSTETHERVVGGSVRALIRDYKLSPEWAALAPKTQSGYARALDQLRPIGDFQADNVRRSHIVQLRNKLGRNTRSMDLFVSAVSRMFTIGMDLGYTDRNPAARIARLNDSESFLPWSAESRAKFEASVMPEWMRMAYMLGLWTSQRESDILRLPRSRFDGVGFSVRQGRPEAKRGKGRKGPVVQLYIPAAQPLLAYLNVTEARGLLFVCDDLGRPVRADRLRHEIRAHLDSLQLTDLHFHGLRHTTATALAEAGASTQEIMAITGHQTEQMVKVYTKRVEQKRLAGSAIRKLDSGRDKE